MLDGIIKEHNVTASYNIKEDIRIIGNRALLVTAISNIIRNSIEAGANHIEIRTRRKGQKTKIEIADDGTGIEQSMVGQIFDPFFSKKGQSGIGLYLTKRIIELHRGQVEFARNEKTVFIITLPR
jgi:signal transduction histidine kinase